MARIPAIGRPIQRREGVSSVIAAISLIDLLEGGFECKCPDYINHPPSSLVMGTTRTAAQSRKSPIDTWFAFLSI
jgi:hypothetical protein